MGWADSSAARARAAVSKASADVAELNSALTSARATLSLAAAQDDIVDRAAAARIARAPVVTDLMALSRAQTAARRARAQADVDELQADLESALNRLSLAERSASALDRFTSDADTSIV